MATATLPGGGSKNNVTITIGSDANVALQTAINSLFKAAGKNITANTVASGAAGKAGFFNYLPDTVATKSATNLKAGINVQAIIDTQGHAGDTLTGGTKTTLLVGNASGDRIINKTTATVFGGAGNDTVDVTGKVSAYLEAGKNSVNLNGADSVSLLGTGGSDTVNISAGANTVSAMYAANVSIMGTNSNDTLTLGSKSAVTVSGAKDRITLAGNGSVSVMVTGSGDTINAGAGAATITAGAGTVSVMGSTGKLNFTAGAGATTVTAGSGAASVTGGKGTINFAHGVGGRDTFVAGTGKITLKGAGTDTKGSDLFKFNVKTAQSTVITSFSASKDTISIAGATAAQIKTALGKATVTGTGTNTKTVFTVGNDHFTVTGGALTTKNVIP